MQSRVQNSGDPYFSRLTDSWEMVPREDPVLWGDGDFTAGPLSTEALIDFRQQGFHFHPQLFSAEEAGLLLAEAERLAQSANPRSTGVIIEPGSRAVRSVFRVHRTNPVFRDVCRDRRLADTARQILGSDVYVHQSRINYKPAFDGKEFFWHSDFETWHVEDGMPRMRALSVSLSLTASTEFNGPLMVVPGSHRHYVRCQGQTPENHFQQSLQQQRYGVPSLEAMQKLVAQGGIVAPKGPGGSALLFDCNLMHGSTGNLSPLPRTNLFIVYNSVENAVTQPFGSRPPRPEFLAEREIVPVGAV